MTGRKFFVGEELFRHDPSRHMILLDPRNVAKLSCALQEATGNV